MTLAELENQIREEMILAGDEAGLERIFLQKVQPLGLTVEDVRRLMDKVRAQLDNDRDVLDHLQRHVRTIGQRRANQLTNDDLNLIAADAARLHVDPDFVRNRWVPALLGLTPPTPPAPVAAAPTPPSPSVAAAATPATAAPAGLEDRETVRRKIKEILDEYDRHIPAQNLRFLFKAISYDEQALAKEILAYLSEHFYASAKNPRGQTLKEKLLSTDWRHLSWWEKSAGAPDIAGSGVVPEAPQPQLISFEAQPVEVRRGEGVRLHWKAANVTSVTLIGVGQNLPPEGSRLVMPARTTTYTLKDSNGNVLGLTTVEVERPGVLSEWAGVWGILLALLMLALTIWAIQHEPEPDNARQPPARQTAPRR